MKKEGKRRFFWLFVFMPVLLLVATLGFVTRQILVPGGRLALIPITWEQTGKYLERAFPRVSAITTADLAAWLLDESRKRPLVIDVRTREEFEVSHLPDAVFGGTEKALGFILSKSRKDTPMVFYCSVGIRSASIVQRIQDQGFTKVFNLRGSIFQWANEGRPVFRGGRWVQEVHPYNAQWGKLLDKRYHPKANRP